MTIDKWLQKFGLADLNYNHNPSYSDLYNLELISEKVDLEQGTLTNLGAVSVDTGKFTGRSPKDKYICSQEPSNKNIWWKSDSNISDNQPISPDTWKYLKDITLNQLSSEDLFIIDGYCGASHQSRMAVRVVTHVAWLAHFAKNMFIQPTDTENHNFEPDWVAWDCPKVVNHSFKEQGLNSEVFVAFNIEDKMSVIGGTWYGGEVKKGLFSMMNYFLPLKDIGSFHCSANQGESDDVALFFGLSGTGKTTLSADPRRQLIGDDEHGWDDDGVFNLEGGCYAKTIDLSEEQEPDIYRAIKKDALLENVVVDKEGIVDFSSSVKTENTRVSYPINHIGNIVKPVSKGGHAKNIVFLTCDAFGVLPPVAILSVEEAMYQFISGYTARVAGTELGVKEPTDIFSPCYGGPFLSLHPMEYAHILGEKIKKHHAKTYLVNTGWSGGGYGVGKRMSLKITRKIISTILDGSILKEETYSFPLFGFQVPRKIENLDPKIFIPRLTWDDPLDYDQSLNTLARKFKENFDLYLDHDEAKKLDSFSPCI